MSDKPTFRGRLTGSQYNRLNRLLDMLYTPGELAYELRLNRRQFYRVYIPFGLPHLRDDKNRIFINGLVFRGWYLNQYPKFTLKPGEAYCLTCRCAVTGLNPVQQQKSNLIFVVSTCSFCGRTLVRIVSSKRG